MRHLKKHKLVKFMNPLFYFETDTLNAYADQHREQYAAAQPFSHIVMEDFFPVDVAEGVLKEFPSPEAIAWRSYTNSKTENKKLSSEHEEDMGPFTRHIFHVLNSGPFLRFLEQLTGITGLIADPYFRGGGLHQTTTGGHLGIHVDFNFYKRLGLHRRLNLLVYLNKKWEDDWGGALELWSTDGTRSEVRIEPLFNRAVLFTTSEHSYHGHPVPLETPSNTSRKSIALYYYTAAAPEQSADPHSTRFVGKRRSTRDVLERFIPPVAFDILRKFRP